MKHSISAIALSFICLLIIAATVTDYFNLELYANEMHPIKEIEVRYLQPTPIFDMIVDSKCPNILGQLDLFLECLQEQKEKYGIL